MDKKPNSRPSAISAFFQSIEAFENAMVPSLSYLAFRRDGVWHLFRGRINYNFSGYTREKFEVKTANILAGTMVVDGGPAEARKIVETLEEGALTIGRDRLLFEPQYGGGYASVHIPLIPEGAEKQFRMGLLQIRGSDQQGFLSHAPFDWELRAAATPFDGVGELLSALSIVHLPEQASLFEVMTFQIAAIDASSTVGGTKARLGISLAPRLDHAKASVGYRVISSGTVVARGRIAGSDLNWTSEAAREIAWTELEVPPAAVVQAFACYDGIAYQHWWLQDPQHSQNPRRAAFMRIDPGLTTLTSFLGEQPTKQARDLEFAVSWLLWLLGFSPAHIGANQKMSDAADILVTTPQGHFAVVECTTSVLKSGHKLSLLVERTELIRQALRQSNSQYFRVLPIIVTTKTREEIKAELDDARRSGIVVVTRDDLPLLIERTLLISDPDQIYVEAEQTLRESEAAPVIEPEFHLDV
ncbi:hypothetical protein [Sphingomonas sanxanigenens]|uniref:Uncharacterized protein n=1 Tax=Sphingomonas sanxanigenens DSM 19645 = NX02 TaxID=1123269 RepID=W0AEG9_9SPHN|nr:hypothetical protein [Sphingomonas sanxanigenens]AHE55471.1 hypothetical protein NX02_19035 [Sphingomonas sanxanigenens DSM 19645 = NX02]